VGPPEIAAYAAKALEAARKQKYSADPAIDDIMSSRRHLATTTDRDSGIVERVERPSTDSGAARGSR
jgi:hypothetical protein